MHADAVGFPKAKARKRALEPFPLIGGKFGEVKDPKLRWFQIRNQTTRRITSPFLSLFYSKEKSTKVWHLRQIDKKKYDS